MTGVGDSRVANAAAFWRGHTVAGTTPAGGTEFGISPIPSPWKSLD